MLAAPVAWLGSSVGPYALIFDGMDAPVAQKLLARIRKRSARGGAGSERPLAPQPLQGLHEFGEIALLVGREP